MVNFFNRLFDELGKKYKYKPVPLNWYKKYCAFVERANAEEHNILKKEGIDPDAIEAEVDKLMEQEPND